MTSIRAILVVGLALAIIFGMAKGKVLAQSSPGLPENAVQHMPVCPHGPKEDEVRCHARVVTDKKGKPNASATPVGYGPLEFQKAYALTGLSSGGKIVAIVDAFDHPSIKSDLDTYSNALNLPVLPNCNGTIASSPVPCFQKVDQSGGTNYPSPNEGWALEIALDVEVAHAACPDCKILLVEANDNTYTNLMTAVDRAVTAGAKIISNSYGSGEFLGETQFDSHFNLPGIAFTFSSGDSGYGASYPAASKYVTAVGGTTLYLNADNTYKSETTWTGSGSGCSRYEGKPLWQTDQRCLRRTIADVAAVADPQTGAGVYTSYPYAGQTGWFKVGGTSLSAPLVASVYALGGGILTNSIGANEVYSKVNYSTNMHDVTSGSNGGCSKRDKYLCSAVSGYDGPTGLGTPNGISAF